MPNTTPKHTKTTRFRAAAVLSVLFVVLALAAGVTYARYAMGKQGKGVLSSPEFYFSSDLLFQSPETYTLNQGSGGSTSFTFELRNYVDALRINKNDIGITVTVAPSDGVCINGTETAQATLTLTDGNSANVLKATETVTVSGLKNGKTYTIEATGNAGFEQTVSATVKVKPDEPNIYMHLQDENDYYVLLTVWTKNLKGNVQITYKPDTSDPRTLIPDATDPVMTGKGSDLIVDETNFKSTYSTHVYRFFKDNPGKNFNGSFTVSIDHDANNNTPNIEATPATPE